MECCEDLAGVEGRVVWIAILQDFEEKIRLRNENEEDRDLCGLRQDGVGDVRRRRRSVVVKRKQPRWRRRSKRGRNLLQREAMGVGGGGMVGGREKLMVRMMS